MQLSVKVDLRSVERTLADMQRQIPFAMALTLTKAAKAVQAAMPQEMTRTLDRPTPFTTRGVYVVAARKDLLVAKVGIKDLTYQYLRKQIEGGTFEPDKSRLKLPASVALNQYGNIPKGLIRQLVRRAQSGKRLTKSLSSKSGLGQGDSLFYGKPRGINLPEGIYRRTGKGLEPVVVFPRKPARYRKRFDFFGFGVRVAGRELDRAVGDALAQVLRSAR